MHRRLPARASHARASQPMRSLFTTVPVAIAGSIALSLGATPASAVEIKMRDGVREGQSPTGAFGQISGANAIAAAPAPRIETSVRTAARPATHVVQPGDTVTRIAIRAGLRTIDVLTWNGLSWSSTIYPGQVLRLTPGGSAAPAAKPAAAKPAAAPASSGATYTVKAGDTVWGIAYNHKTTVAAILRANGLSESAVIYPGQKLKVSGSAPAAAKPAAPASASRGVATSKPVAASGATYTVKAGDTVWGIAHNHGTTVAALIKLNGLGSSATIFPGQKLKVSGSSAAPAAVPAAATSPAPAAAPAGAKTHEVKAGDTLWAIAAKHGASVATILKANGLSEGAIIYPGQKLKLSAPTPKPAAATAAAQEDPRIQRSAVLDAEQAENARLIIAVGRQLGVPDRGIAIALATAMVESNIRNLDYGDRDSLGLFQQRPSAGWGTPAQILDRERSTRVFYGGPSNPNKGNTRGLLDIRGWQSMEFTDAAQAVQISAFPNRYGQWETAAYGWLAQLG
ncbi:LysM peptidoglycan-binding domain-containing protein [Microbacterium sp. MEC084]|uniref:LysM peptidoglycan-binding domain-containing protein n=1 Tax=unclassified Microbacterium TaxID=2609290 RepID=UPI00106F717F|nr:MULTISPECIES: LysM peptidoglycan-binding domain-containing protein [unclassified Microbacterium]MCD1268632.1 LysM peptidoglycan-binding domain-containing protein [Microbacterium sp. MEC084]